MSQELGTPQSRAQCKLSCSMWQQNSWWAILTQKEARSPEGWLLGPRSVAALLYSLGRKEGASAEEPSGFTSCTFCQG